MILFHIVRAGSMTAGDQWLPGFSWTASQVPVLPNGLTRLVSMPKQFNLDVRVPSGGATGPIFRQCNKPQTTLLLVVKNWDNLGEGADWLVGEVRQVRRPIDPLENRKSLSPYPARVPASSGP